ncbi:MAG: Zn-ribbon domain-containing OB-fold protein, partial [Candidatus Rokuibacteriota bacterium]
LHHDLDGRPMTRPRLIGFVQIEDTDGGLVAPLALDPATVHIGRHVSAVLRPQRQRRGVIEDILHFR